MLGILGSGFGLYGYLPAAVQAGFEHVLLPSSYKARFEAREELVRFKKKIVWVDSDEALLKVATTLVVARRPIDQFTSLSYYLSQGQLRKIVFEKPLAPCPDDALRMLALVKASGKQCCAGFIFRFTPWAAALKLRVLHDSGSASAGFNLKWRFMAHHYDNDLKNWKSDHFQGGGVLRFYGIHFIALLAEFGYTEVTNSELASGPYAGTYSSWKAVFSGPRLPQFMVEVDSGATVTSFEIQSENSEILVHKSKTPFDPPAVEALGTKIDPRCLYLQDVLSEVIPINEPWPGRLLDATNLWEMVETSTKFRSE